MPLIASRIANAAVLCLMLVVFAGVARAGTVTLTWTHDQTACSDGSTNVADCPTTGFEIWQGSSETATDYVRVATGISAPTRTNTLTNVRSGRKCWYVIATSPAGNSVESNRACATVPYLPPKAPFLTTAVAITTSSP